MMKKIVFLIETENSKFLVKKQGKNYILPAIISENNYDIQKLTEIIKEEYNLDIQNINKVRLSSQYILLKCRLCSKYDIQTYVEDILKNIVDFLSESYQKEIISDIIFEIHKELLNDAIWLGVLLSAKIEIKNIYLKTIITGFVLFNSTIFCDEVLNYGFGELKKDSNISKSMIKKLRNYYLKEFPSYSSKKTKKIFNTMGINLDKYDFDICLYTYNNQIIDINSRMWDENYKNNQDLYNGIVLTPRNWIKNMFPDYEILFEDVRKPFVNLFKTQLEKVNVKNKIYSAYKLLDKNLDENSKTYILQRIGLLKTMMLMSKLFFKKNYIASSENIEISFDKLLRKSKAVIIEMLGKDREKVSVLKNILDNLPYELDKNFFVLNRNCRNNLHYGFYNELSKNEIEVLDNQQDIYLNYVISEMEKHMKLKLNFSHYLLLGLAFLDRWTHS